MTFTVTATQTGSASNGMAMVVKVVTGASLSQPGMINGSTSTIPNLSITPSGTGSWVYGSILGLTGAYTPEAGTTTFSQNVSGAGLEFIQFRSTSTTTSGTPVLLGATASSNSISIALVEILTSGVLAEDVSSPAATGYQTSNTITTASFSPPAGALLVAMVSSNGGGSVASITITDTSGLGLIWTQQENQNGAGNGYSGVFTASIPGGVSSGVFFPFFAR